MKTILRILIILLVALVVVGVTLAFTNSSGTAQTAPDFQEGGQHSQMGDGNFSPGERPEGGPGGEHEDSSFTFAWLRHLLPIAGIVFVVVIIERFWGKIFKPRSVPIPVK